MKQCLRHQHGTTLTAWCDSVRGQALSIAAINPSVNAFGLGYQPSERDNLAAVHSEGWDL